MAEPDPAGLATEVRSRLSALPEPTTDSIRQVRSEISKRIRDWPGELVIDAALRLLGHHRWVAYELVYHHREAMALLDEDTVLRFADGPDSWGAVDSFCRYIAGPTWRRRQIDDHTVLAWSSSADRWWRRAALVATVPLNLRAAGGTGDRDRTIAVCRQLVDDRDDMVVKALSWALRELVVWDAAAVRDFLDEHDDTVAPQVRREVLNKLNTNLKSPRRAVH